MRLQSALEAVETNKMWIDYLLGLLPGETAKDITIKRNEYVGSLGQLYVTLKNLKRASETFLNSMEDMESFLPFDAHVSDCGCHLRAQMLMERVKHYKENKGDYKVFKKIIEACNESLAHTSSLMEKLCWLEQSPAEFGLPKVTAKSEDIKKAVGWDLSDAGCMRDVKYIYYCFTLSRFKKYLERSKKDSVEVDFDTATNNLNKSVCSFTCQGKGKLGEGCRYLKHARIGKGYVKSQTATLQARLSKVSIEFLLSCVPDLKEELEEFCIQSKKSIWAIPALLQFKALERIWASEKTPLYLAIRFYHGDVSRFVYTSAHVEPSLQWKFYEDPSLDRPHIATTFECEYEGVKSASTRELTEKLYSLQPKMRSMWYTFMYQHKQYPFETDRSSEDKIKMTLYLANDLATHFEKVDLSESITLEPKHIFLEYPRAVSEKQAKVNGKAGTLLIS